MFLLLSKKYSEELEKQLQFISSYDKIISKTEISEAFVKSRIDALLNMKNYRSVTYKELSTLIEKGMSVQSELSRESRLNFR